MKKLLLILPLLFIGCSEDKALLCDDKKALKGIYETLENSYKAKRKKEIIANIRGRNNYKMGREAARSLNSQGMGQYAPKQPPIQYEQETVTPEQEKQIAEDYKKLNARLDGIVTESIDDKTRKTSCSATVVHSDGFQLRINYRLAKTSNNDIYYELDLR